VADYVQRTMKANFAAAWDEMGPTNELEETYALSSVKSLEEGVKNIIQYLGLQPCERSEKIPEGKSAHTLFLAGTCHCFLSTFLVERIFLYPFLFCI
jgi:coatomer protein complex subunit gamma